MKKKHLHIFIAIFIAAILLGLEAYKKIKPTSLDTSQASKVEALIQSNDRASKSNESTSNEIPSKVYKILQYVRKNHRAPDGYVGGREFKNLEHHLKSSTTNGIRIRYREWDVNPKQEGRNRGRERLVTGDDESAWYTNDHYNTFKEVK